MPAKYEASVLKPYRGETVLNASQNGRDKTEAQLAFIGGSGLYEIDGLESTHWVAIDTPWGRPSDEILTGQLGKTKVAFLPRHGRGHIYSPSEIPYRANIAALKSLGVTDIVSLSACGSLREDYAPGDLVMVDQFIDRTFARAKSFFGTGCVGHVSMANPTCGRLRKACFLAAQEEGAVVHDGGTYLAMEGPQFSTLAESRLYRKDWNCDVIGMTNMPEAKLAREAEICYATIAMVTDYDSWHPDHGEIDIRQLIETLMSNVDTAKGIIKRLSTGDNVCRGKFCPYGCDRALDHAIITSPDNRCPDMLEKLMGVAGRVLKPNE